MSDRRRAYVKRIAVLSAAFAVVLLAAAAIIEKHAGALTAGVALGTAGSFGILALRVMSVSKALSAGGGRQAGRRAFVYSLCKMAIAGAALAAGALLGAAGAIGVLIGLLVTTAATVGEAVWSAAKRG
ncbi:MAG: hypothetical protein ACYTAN_04385 [Planctomycetota bacterium]